MSTTLVERPEAKIATTNPTESPLILAGPSSIPLASFPALPAPAVEKSPEKSGEKSPKPPQHPEALGRSVGVHSTKIYVVGDALGLPIRFLLSGGEAAEISIAPSRVAGLEGEHLLADKGYDSDAFVSDWNNTLRQFADATGSTSLFEAFTTVPNGCITRPITA